MLTVSKVGDHSRGWPEGSLFDSLLHQCVGEGATPFPGLLHFTLDPYLIMLSVKQGGIKYHFLSLWYDSTWDRTQVSRAIGEHSNRQACYSPYKFWQIYVNGNFNLLSLLEFINISEILRNFNCLNCNGHPLLLQFTRFSIGSNYSILWWPGG